MKNVLKSVAIVFALFLCLSQTSQAQSYKNAIGGRFGGNSGVTFKTSVGGNKMLDFIGNFRSNSSYSQFQLTGLYEIYNPINGAQGLNWYYGVGGSVGSYKVKNIDKSDVYLAVNGVLGLDYKFNAAPINLSLDWIPEFSLTPNTGFYAGGVGLSVRFTF